MNAPLHNHPAYSRPRPMNEIERRAFEAEPEERWAWWKVWLAVIVFNAIAWPLVGLGVLWFSGVIG